KSLLEKAGLPIRRSSGPSQSVRSGNTERQSRLRFAHTEYLSATATQYGGRDGPRSSPAVRSAVRTARCAASTHSLREALRGQSGSSQSSLKAGSARLV